VKRVLLVEFFGTAVVTYSFTLSLGDSLIRALAYFIGYLLAHHLSGAHFNPAISIAVFVNDKLRAGERSAKALVGNPAHKDSFKLLIAILIIQIIGAFLGILITLLLAKDYVISFYLLPNLSSSIYYYFDVFTQTSAYYFTRIFAQEAIQTFVFVLVFLSIRG
jgi:glycerol uptake facilitator-like aquaporin